MTHLNQDLIDQFFAAYTARDLERLRTILADDVTWTFPGHHQLSGTYIGVAAIVAFFDAMGTTLGLAQPTIERLVTGFGEQHVVECQHIRASQPGTPTLDQPLVVLWTIVAGKIVAGRHLVADQDAFDAFFAALI